MDLSDLLKNRSSIRRYQDKKLTDDIVKSLVESSITAPSPSNSQPVRYFHLLGDEIKKMVVFSNILPPVLAQTERKLWQK